MGRIQSTRITGDTNVQSAGPCVYNGYTLSPTGTVSDSRTVSVYADNTGTGTTNLIARYVITPSSTIPIGATFVIGTKNVRIGLI